MLWQSKRTPVFFFVCHAVSNLMSFSSIVSLILLMSLGLSHSLVVLSLGLAHCLVLSLVSLRTCSPSVVVC